MGCFKLVFTTLLIMLMFTLDVMKRKDLRLDTCHS
jgi:hypothetical protein